MNNVLEWKVVKQVRIETRVVRENVLQMNSELGVESGRTN
jgi:hypothetical protein